MSPTETFLFAVVYIAPMPAMLPFFGRDDMDDADTDEPAGEAREYRMRDVLMMLFWLPMMVITGVFAAAVVIAGAIDKRAGS